MMDVVVTFNNGEFEGAFLVEDGLVWRGGFVTAADMYGAAPTTYVWIGGPGGLDIEQPALAEMRETEEASEVERAIFGIGEVIR